MKFAFGIIFVVFYKYEFVLCRGICCTFAWNIKTEYAFVQRDNAKTKQLNLCERHCESFTVLVTIQSVKTELLL